MSSPGRVQDHVHPEQHEREGERAQRLKWEAMVRDVEVTVGVACDLGHVRRAVIDLFRRVNVERCGAVLGAAVALGGSAGAGAARARAKLGEAGEGEERPGTAGPPKKEGRSSESESRLPHGWRSTSRRMSRRMSLGGPGRKGRAWPAQ